MPFVTIRAFAAFSHWTQVLRIDHTKKTKKQTNKETNKQTNKTNKGRVHKTKSGKSLVFCQTGGGVSEGSKMPNLYFGVLKRVKNGLKMAKKHIEILYFS